MPDDDTCVILEDEDGNEVAFEAIDVFEFEGQDYVVLVLPSEEEEEEGPSLYFMRLHDGDDPEFIEDNEEFERVVKAYVPDMTAET